MRFPRRFRRTAIDLEGGGRFAGVEPGRESGQGRTAMDKRRKFQALLAMYLGWLVLLGAVGYLSGRRPTVKPTAPARSAQP